MIRKNIVFFILIISLVLIFWTSSLLQNYFEQAAMFLKDYVNYYPLQSILIFIGLATISTMLIAFSSIWLVSLAIILWSNSLTVAFLLSGWLIGAIFSYIIGRYGGYPIVKKLFSTERILYYEHLICQKFSFQTIFLFRLTLPSEILGYVLGIVRYPFIKYFLITFLSEIPYAIYTVYAIDSIINRKPIIFILAAIVWLAATFFLVYFYRKEIKNKKDGITAV